MKTQWSTYSFLSLWEGAVLYHWTSFSPELGNRFQFNVQGLEHCKYIPIYIQQDATLHSLFVTGNCSTRFGWYRSTHNCIYSIWYLSHCYCCLPLWRQVAVMVWQVPDTVDTVVCAPDDSWRHSKLVEQFPDTNKPCNVASCWIYIGINRFHFWNFMFCLLYCNDARTSKTLYTQKLYSIKHDCRTLKFTRSYIFNPLAAEVYI